MGYKLADVIWNDDGTMANKGYIAEYEGIPVDANINNKLKALEIIKEKGINVFELRFAFSLEEYNICKGEENKELTQEEYDLLKEVLL